MTNQEAIMRIKEHVRIHQICEPKAIKISEALDLAISALEAQELFNNSPKLDSGNGECRAINKPKMGQYCIDHNCPWYDGKKCNSPNDPGYNECDFDRGILPESYESDDQLTCNNDGDLISRKAAKEAYCKKFCHPGVMCPDISFCREVDEAFDSVPSAQPEYHIKSVQSESDKIYGIMKDYYFEHKDEHNQSWQGGFAKCMNLIPNVWERREDGSD